MCLKIDQMKAKKELNIPLGINENGEQDFLDLDKARHVLVAGRTGSGKSTFLHKAIKHLTKNYSKDEVRLFLIDFKQTEFNKYQNLSQIKPWAVKDYGDIVFGLYWIVEEIESRKKEFEKENVFNIEKFNQKTGKGLPYIVVIVDEVADLISPNTECGYLLQWIASYGYGVGVYLIISTQAFAPDVLVPELKANLQTRICFPVSDIDDSFLIIHEEGAEKLSVGEFLYKSPEHTKIKKYKMES